jgi:protein-tyrosine phosphatase
MFNYLKTNITQVANTAAEKIKTAVENVDTSQFNLDKFNLDNLQKQMNSLEDSMANGIPDGSSPDHMVNGLDFTYVTPRIVAMGFPENPEKPRRGRRNPIGDISNLLNTSHTDRYMIWNLSEEEYDYELFNNQVQEYRFPGHPAPPLGLMFQICTSVESWLSQDTANVAVIHCMTGRGRTASVIACVLSWIGEIESPIDALQHVANKRRTNLERLVIPSQRRYVQYFTSVMDGVKPRSEPVKLKRVIVNTIPRFFKNGKTSQNRNGVIPNEVADGNDGNTIEGPKCDGCRPYLQVFKNGKLLYSSTWSDSNEIEEIPKYFQSDGSFAFNVDCILDGDVLVRCRHINEDGKRLSMFRAAFHTGYIPQGIQRLPKNKCDGAANDRRFDVDFFVDLIFEPARRRRTKLDANNILGVGFASPVLTGDYDEVMRANSKFWSEISKRKEKIRQAKAKGWRSIVDRRPIGDKRSQSQSNGKNNCEINNEPKSKKKDAFSILDESDDISNLVSEKVSPAKILSNNYVGSKPTKASPVVADRNAKNGVKLTAATKTTTSTLGKKAQVKSVKENEEDYRKKKLEKESKQSLDELAELEQELGLESFSDEIRQLDADIKTKDSTANNMKKVKQAEEMPPPPKSPTGDNSVKLSPTVIAKDDTKNVSASSGGMGTLEDELHDLDAELALLGEDDEFDDSAFDDADFADLEKEFDEIDGL